MNIKDIFDKATTENKSLTYAEFEALAKESKAKFTDLAEGKYVDRQKYLDEIAAKDTELTTLNSTLSERDSDLSTLRKQLEEAGNDSVELEKLSTSLSELQAKYEADTQSLQGKLQAQAYEFAVRDFANGQKFSSAAAKRDFERSMLAKNLPMENGNIMGAKDYMKEYVKDNEDAFVKATKNPEPAPEPKPQFSAPANGQGTKNSKMSLTELMQMKNENPDAVINFD